MRLAILGATGRIGGHLMNWALDAGHPVQALARDAAALPRRPGLRVTEGDARDLGAVTEVIADADAVLSALGPRGSKAPGLLAGAARSTVDAMRMTGARRLICVSAAGAYVTADPAANAPSPATHSPAAAIAAVAVLRIFMMIPPWDYSQMTFCLPWTVRILGDAAYPVEPPCSGSFHTVAETD